jgi:hypothetical protein
LICEQTCWTISGEILSWLPRAFRASPLNFKTIRLYFGLSGFADFFGADEEGIARRSNTKPAPLGKPFCSAQLQMSLARAGRLGTQAPGLAAAASLARHIDFVQGAV